MQYFKILLGNTIVIYGEATHKKVRRNTYVHVHVSEGKKGGGGVKKWREHKKKGVIFLGDQTHTFYRTLSA